MSKRKKSESSSSGAKAPAAQAKPRGNSVTKAVAAAAATKSASASPGAPATLPASSRKPTPEQISARAHQIWVDAGKPQGAALDHWLRAERELADGPR